MKLRYNDMFLYFLNEYGLPTDLSFSCFIPKEVQEKLDSDILDTDLGITLRCLNGLRKPEHTGETHSTIEYDENHFHVDWYTESDKEAFKLGVKTLLLLAEKFEQQQISGVRFYYLFQTPELCQKWASEHKLHENGDEYYIGDRLSFHRLRQNESNDPLPADFMDSPYEAHLVIDI